MIEPMPFRCPGCGHEIHIHPATPAIVCEVCGGQSLIRAGHYRPAGPPPKFVPPSPEVRSALGRKRCRCREVVE